MNLAVLADFFEHPTLPASSEKYAMLVYDSTLQLQQSLDSILSALNLRAMGATMCANYESAVRDAQFLQRMSPSSPLGYIREAEVYIQQGKPQRVIEVCDHALDHVDEKDTHYATLKRTREDAEQRQNIRIDFISKLPFDIAMTTLIPMLMPKGPLKAEEHHPQLHVSTGWRDRIIQCLGGLEFYIDFHHEGLPQVARFAQYTKKLIISHYAKGTWLGDLLLGNNFGALRDLCVYQYRNPEDGHFLSALKSISNTLTDLFIHVDDTVFSIADIISTCPNLNSLRAMGFHGVYLSTLPTTPMPNMTVLSITNAKDMVSQDEVGGIVQRFPSLKKLILSPCNDLQSAYVVPKYCPSLQGLRVDVSNEGEAELSYTDQLEEEACGMQGITDLCLRSFMWHGFNQHEMASLLKQYSSTLKRLEWNIPLNDDNDNKDIITTIQYPCLRVLRIESFGWWLPRNAPMLEELKITSNAIYTNHTVLDTIPPKLKKLALHMVHQTSLSDDMSHLIRYIQRFSHHTHLKELAIHLPGVYKKKPVLQAICCLNQLERLTILDSKWVYTRAALEEIVKCCPRLLHLDIRLGKTPCTHAINTLKRLEHLQQFTFAIDGTKDLADLWEAFQTFPQLTCIRIRPVNRVNKENKDAIRSLMMKRPDMEVIIDRTLSCFL